MYYVVALLLFLGVSVIYLVCRADLWGPLAKVPGPFWARWTSLWELRAQKGSQNYTIVVHDLHRRFGPVVRLAPGRYSIADPQAANDIYHHGSKFIKGPFYHGFGALVAGEEDKIFVDRDPVRHAKNRRDVASLYSMSTLRSYEPFVDDTSAVFKDRLIEFARNGNTICLPDWLQYYAFDVIGMMTFSHPFGLLESGEDHLNVLNLIYSSIHVATSLGLAAPRWFLRLSKIRQRLPSPSRITMVNRWVAERVQERSTAMQKERSSLRSDFAEKTLDLQEKGKLSQAARLNVVSQNIAAGSDTTGVSLGAIAWYLATNARVAAKLREELATSKREGRLSQPVTFAEANAMPYLQAVIKESLRMHPAVGVMLERVVPRGGATLCGYHFPEGASVGCSAWELNYDEGVWGRDADVFRPERWLEDAEAAKRMDGALFSFGAGSRTCLGKNISLLEMAKLVPELYRRFDFELVSPQRSINASWFVYHKFDVRVRELDQPI